MIPQILVGWHVPRASSYSPEFSLPAASARVVLVIVAKRIKPNGAALHFKLQRQAVGNWEDEQDSSGTSLSGTSLVHYIHLNKPVTGSRRLEAVSRSKEITAEVEVLLADGRDEGTFEIVRHPIEELGPDVVKKLPALQDGLERSLADGLGQTGGAAPPESIALTICGIWSVHVHPAPCPDDTSACPDDSCPTDSNGPCPNDAYYCNIIDIDYAAAQRSTGPLKFPVSMAQFLLANRFQYERTPREALDALASNASMTATNLQTRIDEVNALAEVLSKFSARSKS
jgi:hypothetical protein